MFVLPLVKSKGLGVRCPSTQMSCNSRLFGGVALYEAFEDMPKLSGPFEQSRDRVLFVVPWPYVPVLRLDVMAGLIIDIPCLYEG